MNNQTKLIEFLTNHAESNSVSFHMPGHKGRELFDRLGYGEVLIRLADMDVTEIYGADNLFRPDGIILDLMERYSDLYRSRETFLSVGGSSNGLMAAIMAAVETAKLRSQSKDAVVVISRNSHKSVFNGVNLSGAETAYLMPEFEDEWEIAGRVLPSNVEQALDKLKKEGRNIAAVVITSPNYYGICSDIAGIAEICHDNNTPLIVDQAHGAHLKFLNPNLAAENCNADIVVNSIHKTLAGFTQTAIVNLYGDLVDNRVLAEKMQVLQSTSPSYILMASLAINAEIIEDSLFEDWRNNLEDFYSSVAAIGGLKAFRREYHDDSKILIRAEGISGDELKDRLRLKGIHMELSDVNMVMAMTGIGNSSEDYKRLLNSLEEICEEHGDLPEPREAGPSLILGLNKDSKAIKRDLWETKETVMVDLKSAVGNIASEAIIPYPPGIVLVAAGEVIEDDAVTYMADALKRGHVILGVDRDGKIPVKIL